MADDEPVKTEEAPQPIVKKYRFDESSLQIKLAEFSDTGFLGHLRIDISHSATSGTNVAYISEVDERNTGSIANVPPADQQVIADFIKHVMRRLNLIN